MLELCDTEFLKYQEDNNINYLALEDREKLEVFCSWLSSIIAELGATPHANAQMANTVGKWQTILQSLSPELKIKDLITKIMLAIDQVEADKGLVQDQSMRHQRFFSSYDTSLFFRSVQSREKATLPVQNIKNHELPVVIREIDIEQPTERSALLLKR